MDIQTSEIQENPGEILNCLNRGETIRVLEGLKTRGIIEPAITASTKGGSRLFQLLGQMSNSAKQIFTRFREPRHPSL